MAIDFSVSARSRGAAGHRDPLVARILQMRKAAPDWGLWLPHMPKEWGGVGLKHFVANRLGRVIDRVIQVHGALGDSTDTPLAQMATQARFADRTDEVHQWRIAQRTIDADQRDGSTRPATGDLPL